MSESPILEVVQLDFPWAGLDPFIFTVHHLASLSIPTAVSRPSRSSGAGTSITPTRWVPPPATARVTCNG